ncbi:hypothetical protein PC129_g21003 [Phytophthora cactorum]|uniref:Uncharacterized protein n=1 Tax=Phytophthora cactorum TaxID=29920 RepID=A0A8T1H752_9STRA|nr:hypothetical protein Pcac1_g20270 [Phytophthora cactorum]KAG2831110.1 hypothetical protein PC113_g20983 [Phytophthora cactorum]KAG2837234.1 hypothetical protein PC112_g4959 [Phytophthora cactorum]KAG2839776.1 hypothetical protein PC111_g3713 [Phytophthora cactorum]KAG2877176.1 hypothetical protein PC114_g23798 [Phytophthora cactorum]
MADVLLVTILVSQAAMYLLVVYMFRALRHKHRERSTSELQQALIAREETTGEHRVDISKLDAEEEVVRCRV